MATTSWPRRRRLELPSVAAGSDTSSTTRSRARSVCGSSPSTRALTVRAVGQRQPHRATRLARHGCWSAPGRRARSPRPSRCRRAGASRGRAESRPARRPGRRGRRRRPPPGSRHRTAAVHRRWFLRGYLLPTGSARRRREGAGSRTCPYMGIGVQDVTVLPDRSNKSSVGGAMTADSPHSARFNGCPKRPTFNPIDLVTS